MTVRTAIFGVILSAGALASTGCESLGLGKDSSSRSRDDGRISRDDGRISRDDGIYSRGGGRSSDRIGRNDRLDDPILSGDTYRGGTTSLGRLDDIPKSAVRVREGTDRLTYTADQAGRVYVYDPSADQIVYSGSVSSSDRVTMDPSSGNVLINDRPAAGARLSSSQRYRMYFEPMAR